MRIALIVGVNHYEHGGHLYGCVNDAHSVKAILERHDGGSPVLPESTKADFRKSTNKGQRHE